MESKELVEMVVSAEYQDRESLANADTCEVCGVELFRHEKNLCEYCEKLLSEELAE